MNVFWKPIHTAGGPAGAGRDRSMQGGRLCALWARCDMCGWSGPHERFEAFVKGSDTAYLCQQSWCSLKRDHAWQLISEGWTPLHSLPPSPTD